MDGIELFNLRSQMRLEQIRYLPCFLLSIIGAERDDGPGAPPPDW